MAKQPKQDPQKPEEEALEQHVREMMDITVPDPPAEPAPTPEVAKKPLAIKVVDHTDTPAKNEPEPAAKNELNEAIAQTNEELAAKSATAPLVPSAKAKKTTPIAVTHEDTQPETSAEEPVPEPELEEPAETPAITEEEPPKTVQDAIDEAATVPGEDASPLEAEIESAETDQAVSDIVAQESDELLAVHDAKADVTPVAAKRKQGLFKRWLHSSKARWATFLILFAALVAVGVMPESRYWVLNKAGVKSSASVVVTDASTLRPLKNADVTLAGQSVRTDAEGKAQLNQLRLGPSELVVKKRAFAEEKKSVTIGWGSNPLGDVALRPQGNQYTFVVTDIFSGKPIANAEATAGEASATSGDDGKIVLTLEETDADKLDVTIKAAGYRDEIHSLDMDAKEDVPVSLTPSRKVAFVSKRTGVYSVYTIDADAKNEKLVLAGTGNEINELAFAQHPTADRAVLVSTRDGKRADDGALLHSLTVVNLDDGTTKTVIESPQIRLVDWAGNRIVYVQQSTGAGNEDPQRYKLMSYDYVSGDNRQLAAANYFNDVVVVESQVYYAPASAYQNGVNVGVFVVDPGGSGKKPILDQESWNIYRPSYDHLILAVQQDWYDYAIGSDKPEKLSGQPNNTSSRVYATSLDGARSVWLDVRDGKGTIISYDKATKAEAVVYAQSGITSPIRWLNNSTLIYRVGTDTETADYIVSTQGGEPRKLTDVTNTVGIDRWSY